MPRDDNAAVLAAQVIERLATPGPIRLTPVHVPVPRGGRGGPARRGRPAARGAWPVDDPSRAEAALERLCDPMYARALRALVRDTFSPDVVHAGRQVQRDPGRRDGRGRLPGAARA